MLIKNMHEVVASKSHESEFHTLMLTGQARSSMFYGVILCKWKLCYEPAYHGSSSKSAIVNLLLWVNDDDTFWRMIRNSVPERIRPKIINKTAKIADKPIANE